MNSVDKLMMQIGLQDYATKPLKGIQKTVTQTADVSRQSWEQMAGGAAGLVGSGFAIKQALMPAIEMDRVLGEVKSLGVIEADLETLQQTALEFSSAYGKSATEMVSAAYDIKSAMGEMSGAELSGVTKSSAILAAATKADTGTITSYMGTMYSVFQSKADAMGKDNWAERVAGMTAKSVEKFKTTGQGMADAFKGIGSLARTHGIEMQNQMAILGMLQGSMSGSEAGTKYKAFLTGAVNAQDKLGLSFTDTNGKLLPMYEILDRIKGKFGDLDSTEITQLKSAFGSDEAIMVVTDLIGKTDALRTNISDLNGAANIGTAKNMASAMTDQWERLESSWYAIRAGAFGLVLPAINSIAGAMADGLTTLLGYTQEYPTLTSYAGYLALAIAGSAGVMGAYNLTLGASRLAMNALKAPLLFTKASILGLNGVYAKAKWSLWAFNYSMLKQGVYTKGSSIATKAYAVTMMVANKALLFATGSLKALGFAMLKSAYTTAQFALTSLRTLGSGLLWMGSAAIKASMSMVQFAVRGLASATSAMWAFGVAAVKSGVALLANPIFWIPAAIIAVGAALYGVVKHWDALTNWFTEAWQSAVDFISNLSVFQVIGDGIDWLIDKINLIPGINIGSDVQKPVMPELDKMNYQMGTTTQVLPYQYHSAANMPQLNADVVDLDTRRKEATRPISDYLTSGNGQQQSVVNTISQAGSKGYTDNSKNMHTGDIVIKQEQPFTPEQLAEWQELATP